MLMHMKLVAAKALLLGKLAFFLIFLNVVRNAILGTDYIDEQYEVSLYYLVFVHSLDSEEFLLARPFAHYPRSSGRTRTHGE